MFMPLFTEEEREQIRVELVLWAKSDSRIVAAAHTGSAAKGQMDRWSDIDLALGLSAEVNLNEVLTDWTDRLYSKYHAAAHHDLRHGNTLYRVFLLKNTLQIDLAFWLHNEFGAMGPNFKLIFGAAKDHGDVPVPAAQDLIGMAWLYALHARSSILRGRMWQAEYMLSGLRDQVLALSCLRNGLPVFQGRGVDELPPEITNGAVECLVRSLAAAELKRAFCATIDRLLKEIESVDVQLSNCLASPLNTLIESLG
jgi:hypothetical protein